MAEPPPSPQAPARLRVENTTGYRSAPIRRMVEVASRWTGVPVICVRVATTLTHSKPSASYSKFEGGLVMLRLRTHTEWVDTVLIQVVTALAGRRNVVDVYKRLADEMMRAVVLEEIGTDGFLPEKGGPAKGGP